MLLLANVLFYFVSLYVCMYSTKPAYVRAPYLCTDVYWPLPDSIIFLPVAIRIRTFSPLQKKTLNSFAGNMTIKKKLVFLGWEDRKSENNFPPIDDIFFLVSRSLLVIIVLRMSLHIKEERIEESPPPHVCTEHKTLQSWKPEEKVMILLFLALQIPIPKFIASCLN